MIQPYKTNFVFHLGHIFGQTGKIFFVVTLVLSLNHKEHYFTKSVGVFSQFFDNLMAELWFKLVKCDCHLM